MSRTLAMLLTIVLASAALAGCADNGGDGNDNAPTGGTGGTGGNTGGSGGNSGGNTGGGAGTGAGGAITVGTTDTITSLDPGNAYEYLSINILQNTMANLLTNEPDSAELRPELAAEMPQVSDDGLTYTFTLKPGLKYSDGTPIKASDFLWAMERNSGEVGGSEGGPSFLIYDSPGVDLANSTADDAGNKLVIKLNRPGVFFNSLLVFPNFAPLPQSVYTKDAWREPTGTTQNLPIASGPYRITEYRQGEYVKLEKNPNYVGPRTAQTNTITIKLFADSASMLSAIRNGEIDVAYRSFTPDEWETLSGGAQVRTEDIPGPSPARYLAFNVAKTGTPSADRNVRQAIAQILDREMINEVVFSGTVDPAYSIVAKGLLGQKDSFAERYGEEPNVQRATQLLQQAGYSASNKVRMDLWYNSDGHYGDTEDELAQVIASQLEDTGLFDINLQSKPWADYKNDFRQGSYGMFLIGWYPDYLDPDNYISPFLTEGGARSFGTFYVPNATVTADIAAEQAAQDEDERVEILHRLQDAAAEEVLMLPIFSGKQQVAYREGVQGVTLSPTSVFPYYTLRK